MTYVTDALSDPQNILTIVGIIVSAGFVAYDWLWRSRKVMVYRVQLDTPFSVIPDTPFPDLRVSFERAGVEVRDASMVLLRVANGGSQHIVEADIRRPLCFVFDGRSVIGIEIPEADPDDVKEMLQEDGGLRYEGSRLTLPRVPLNRGNHFKILVLLSGSGSGVKPEGFLRGGKIQKGAGHWQGPSGRVLAAGTVTTLLLGLLAGFVATDSDPAPMTTRCRSGKLQIYGSTAFEPLTDEAAKAYHKGCPSALITVNGKPSLQAIRDLEAAGGNTPGGAVSQIAVSDGLAQGDHTRLKAHPIAVILFSVIVNKDTGVHDLTADQLADIYQGRYRNWRSLDGPDLPIKVVSRNSDSGSRRTFDSKVLGDSEGGATSDDCLTPNSLHRGNPFILCELSSTDELLRKVNSTPGAIGFSEFYATGAYRNLQRLQINGHDADIETAKNGLYPYWTVEHFYTYGQPMAGRLPDAFLRYMLSDPAKVILSRYEHVPCSDPRSGELCARDSP